MHVDRRLIAEAHRERSPLLVAVACGVGAGAAVVLQAAALAHVVARVLLGGAGLSDVWRSLAALAAASVVRAGLRWAGGAAAAAASERMRNTVRARLARHLFALGPLRTARHPTGDLASTLSEGVERLDAYIAGYLPQLALAAVIPAGIAVVVAVRDPLSGLILLATAPLIPLFMALIGGLAARRSREQWRSLARLGAHFLEVVQGLATLKVLGRAREQLTAVRRSSDRFRETTMGVLRIAFLSALVLELTAMLSTAVVAVQVGLRLLYGRMEFEPAFFVLLLAPEFYLPLRRLGAAFHAGSEGVAAADRVYELLGDTPPSAETAPVPVPERLHVRFEDVRFRYPSRDVGDRESLALRGVDLEIRPGERVALVGPSGSGKSTLAGLLLRFAHPSGGRITVDGTPLERIAPEDWRRTVAWVSQHPYLMADTVAANIRLSRPDAPADEIEAASRAAALHDEIAALPDGYDTVLSERGRNLSGGQAQRLAIARAFLADRPLVVLDEPTSHLDVELESRLLESTHRLLADRGALVIAHRLATARRADRIVVLDGGRVVQAGTHHELAAADGPYRRLLSAGGAP